MHSGSCSIQGMRLGADPALTQTCEAGAARGYAPRKARSFRLAHQKNSGRACQPAKRRAKIDGGSRETAEGARLISSESLLSSFRSVTDSCRVRRKRAVHSRTVRRRSSQHSDRSGALETFVLSCVPSCSYCVRCSIQNPGFCRDQASCGRHGRSRRQRQIDEAIHQSEDRSAKRAYTI
jgi:hypothetical protein